MSEGLIIAIISILGTMFVTLISSYWTYYFQKKVSEREKKTALDLEDKRRSQEIEDQKRKIKRELLSNRLDIIEEAVTIRMFLAGLAVREGGGLTIHSDANMIQEKQKRLEEVSNKAWTAVIACNSEELKKNYQAIGTAWWESEEEGTVADEVWGKATNSYHEIIKMIDDLKSSV